MLIPRVTDRFTQWAFNVASWNEAERDGDFVKQQQGSGALGWWHEHNDGTPYGHHPMDFNCERKAYICRDCGAEQVTPLERNT